MLYDKQKDAYRAGPSIDCGLIEGLTHGESHIGGADAGGCFNGEGFSLLGDFHCRAGCCRHCNLPQEHINTYGFTYFRLLFVTVGQKLLD